MRDHRKLRAFQLADDLVIAIYTATRAFPRDELFGLTSQMRRAAVSVAANIVEGSARQGHSEYVHFLEVALGSLRELGYHISLSQRLGYLASPASEQLVAAYNEAARVLSRLIQSLRNLPRQ